VTIINIVINEKKNIELPKIPFIISVSYKDFRLVTRKENKDGDNFFLTDFYKGYTWSSDLYTFDFLEEKLKSKVWLIIESTLTIENN